MLVIKGLGLRRHLIFSAQRPVLLNRHRCVQRGAPEPVLRPSQELVLMGTREAGGGRMWRKSPQALSPATGVRVRLPLRSVIRGVYRALVRANPHA